MIPPAISRGAKRIFAKELKNRTWAGGTLEGTPERPGMRSHAGARERVRAPTRHFWALLAAFQGLKQQSSRKNGGLVLVPNRKARVRKGCVSDRNAWVPTHPRATALFRDSRRLLSSREAVTKAREQAWESLLWRLPKSTGLCVNRAQIIPFMKCRALENRNLPEIPSRRRKTCLARFCRP